MTTDDNESMQQNTWPMTEACLKSMAAPKKFISDLELNQFDAHSMSQGNNTFELPFDGFDPSSIDYFKLPGHILMGRIVIVQSLFVILAMLLHTNI